MKNLIQKISIFSLLIVSLLVVISCNEDDNTTTVDQTLLSRFTRTQNKKTITFINISENATSYVWDFGDGTTSTLINPVKTYVNGSYTITLTAKNDSGETSVFQDSIIIDGCVDETSENINPANGNLNWTFLNANGDAAFGAFGNIGGNIVTNPTLDAVNSSCNVFAYTRSTGCADFAGAGTLLKVPLNFATATNKVFKIKVLAATELTDVTLRLEFQPFPNVNPFQERVASITEIGKWQELTFDFSNVNTGTYQNMIIYFNRGAVCNGNVYYFDDIIQQ
ncbi:PKD domain-containing protein [Polaribacter sp. Hel_I_88]|uniref:PKD domain-containing protein n=1 Tax=Polaribacter sp. Hel_I_88 TaxID=1250006 RepID=UPI00068ACC22|nr:PKD domain-containing protein [Polaribacter sp. Hel_I_88]